LSATEIYIFDLLGTVFPCLEWIAISACAFWGLHMRQLVCRATRQPDFQRLLRRAVVGCSFGIVNGPSRLNKLFAIQGTA
jgi:hypothetical protein